MLAARRRLAWAGDGHDPPLDSLAITDIDTLAQQSINHYFGAVRNVRLASLH
jgi:hypothetical protein